ncbi:arginine-tRNA-protein transferase-like protein 1 [Hortaea werneckii]|nr:arginine-tRNA-protein transferase-like protein 1 [Hortaea werneckii]
MQNSDHACNKLSLLTPIGYQHGDCGYCKAEDSSQRTPNSRASYYARSKSLCPHHYQILMDRGWRRSGTILYLPDAARSCCPHYTIRLPAADFKPGKDQRQSLNRWNRYVLGEKYMKEASIKYPKSKAEKKQENEFNLLSTVHEPEKTTVKPDIPPEHIFTVTLEPDDFTEEKFALFDNYQRHVHHEGDDDISKAGFKRFLCSSPLHRHNSNGSKPLGSWHHCYRLDGRLIAMAVLDLLPHAVSGVYFLYHSDFEKWSFGKLSALREAALALERGYEFYYMGYYIHGCRKMRYKGDYRPQYVLDLHGFNWDPLNDEMRRLMESRPYASMSKEKERVASLEAKGSDGDEPPSKSTKTDAEGPSTSDGTAGIPGQDIKHPIPLEASFSGLSLLELGMPGLTPLPELHRHVDLDSMKVYLGPRVGVHEMQDIVSWHSGAETESGSIKGAIAEYASAVGPEIAREVVCDFSR